MGEIQSITPSDVDESKFENPTSIAASALHVSNPPVLAAAQKIDDETTNNLELQEVNKMKTVNREEKIKKKKEKKDFWLERAWSKSKRARRLWTNRNWAEKLRERKEPAFTLPAILAILITFSTAPTQTALAASLVRDSGAQASAVSTSGLATAQPNIFVELSEKAVPSVVNISTTSRAKGQNRTDDFFRREFERFFRGGPENRRGDRHGLRLPPHGMRNPSDRSRQSLFALGTGVIIDVMKVNHRNEALILTNHHVIDRAETIRVQFSEQVGEQPVEGKIVGKDPDLDLALIKVVTKKKLKALPLGNSSRLKVGEFVMAVGNPFGQGHSVSHGIVSAKGRNTRMILGKYLQTDAPINPGNSGGPLLNLKGEIVGINNAILAQAQGIGFAIPSDEIQKILPQLKTEGKVTRGYIGVMMGEVSQVAASFSGGDVQEGAPYVASVEPDSPAYKAGLQKNDIILRVNGNKVSSPKDLLLEVTSLPVGNTAEVQVIRSGKTKNFQIKIQKRPIT